MHIYACAQSLQLCPVLCNPTDCSPSGSSIHGILQRRVLEWVARSFRGSSWSRIEPRFYIYIYILWLISKFSLAWLNFKQVSSWLWASELPLTVFTLENLKLYFFFFDSVKCFPGSCQFYSLVCVFLKDLTTICLTCKHWKSYHLVANSKFRWLNSLSLFTFMHWRRKWQPTPVFLPGESQGRGSLMSCHLWGRTESDTTEVT